MRKNSVMLALLLSACGTSLPPPNDDAMFGHPPDMSPPCVGDNDGVIRRSEVNFALDVPIRYLANPPNTTVGVAPDGKPGANGPDWDLTSTAGDVTTLTLEPLSSAWFANSFPGATYFTVSDTGSGTLGIFK